MKRSFRPGKTAANLSESVHQQLNMYALAASAAGVGMLALAQPSEAKIVYTPANVAISNNSFYIDLNHDGISELTIGQGCWVSYFHHEHGCGLFAGPSVPGDGIEEGAGHTTWVAALKAGATIGYSKQFRGYYYSSNYMEMAVHACGLRCGTFGYWFYRQARYLGVKFQIKGKTHFGWMRLKNSSYNGATLTGYAYETIPGKSIKAGQTHGKVNDMEASPDSMNPDEAGPGAFLTNPIPDKPQPASLGMLALGAQGVPLWRRKEW